MRFVRALRRFLLQKKFKRQLFIMYLIGGILPLMVANVIMYEKAKDMLIDQTKQQQEQELEILSNSINENISVATDISKRLYFNEEIEHIAFTQYSNYSDVLADYKKCDTIYNYLKYYYHEISNITVYFNNPTISDNAYFVYADGSVKNEQWYQKAIQEEGSPYWSFHYDSLTGKNSLRLSRVLYTQKMRQVGVVSIIIQNSGTENLIKNREEDTLLLYNKNQVVYSNFNVNDDDSLLEIIQKQNENSYYGKIKYKNEPYLLTYVKLQPDYAKEYYTLVSIRPYNSIVKSARKNAIGNLTPILFSAIFAMIALTFVSEFVSSRIRKLQDAMHKAAKGDFEIIPIIEGSDEISDLYKDMGSMIHSIQRLMSDIVEEKVQSEKVLTRQREVEFKMLASQINPHFLYNTLETIRMQARVKNQSDIEELAKMLAKIMRRNIQVGNSLQRLKSELQLVEYYLKIQDYRFHDRITSEIIYQENEIRDLKIMPLLIQPFVENAFVHGMEQKEKDGRIEIRVQVRTHLWITIEDNGEGISKERLDEVNHLLHDFDNLDRTHIGICNVNQRIKLQYGNIYGVKIESIKDFGTKVTIKLPLITDECSAI